MQQIKDEAYVIDRNLQTISALCNLKKVIANLHTAIISDVLGSLWGKKVIIDNPGYLTAEITHNTQTTDFVISEVSIALPQYITVGGFHSITESVTNNEDFKVGTMNIAPKSFVEKKGDSIVLANNNNIEHATLNVTDNELPIEKFTLQSPSIINVKIANKEFLSEPLTSIILDQLTFTSSTADRLELKISQDFATDDAIKILNDAFSIDNGADIEIELGDNLQNIVKNKRH